MDTFTVEKINLSSVDEKTGLHNTASIYRLDGIDRDLSISELALAICLNHAVKYEEEVIEIMADMNNTTYRLEQLSTLESALTSWRSGVTDSGTTSTSFDAIAQYGLDKSDYNGYSNWLQWLVEVAEVDVAGQGVTVKDSSGNYVTSVTGADVDSIITAMEVKMDELNTFSQEKMIELQSVTNKRDQAYDLAGAMLKSFNTVLVGNSNNI